MRGKNSEDETNVEILYVICALIIVTEISIGPSL